MRWSGVVKKNVKTKYTTTRSELEKLRGMIIRSFTETMKSTPVAALKAIVNMKYIKET